MTRFTCALFAVAALRALTGDVDSLAQEPLPESEGLVHPLPGPEAPEGFPNAIEFTDPETAKQHRELGAVDAQIQNLLSKYGTAGDGSIRNRIRASLVAAVERQFTIRQAIRKRELQRIEAELRRLQSVHEQRNAQSSTIVNSRVEQLITEAEGLGWGVYSDVSHGRGETVAVRYGWGAAVGALSPPEESPSGEANPTPSHDPSLTGTAGESSAELGPPRSFP